MNITEVIFLIDKSGSMSRLTNDTIEGFNGFIESQKDDTKTLLTTVLFDTRWKTLHDGLDVYEVEQMTTKDYIAGGGTALLDAIGETINNVQDRHDELGEDKPNKVLFVITTDGEENSSRKFTKAQVNKMIKHQTNGHGWTFMFLGANMDAVSEATSLGISNDYAINYCHTARGTSAVYDTITCATNAIKCGSIDDFNLSTSYSTNMDKLSTTITEL